MRCPYCGAFNSDRTSYCTHCGRDMRQAPPQQPYQPPSRQQPPYQQPRQVPPQQPPQPPYQQPRQGPPQQPYGRPGAATPAAPRPAQNVSSVSQPAPAPPVVVPEPPAPFPSRTIAQLDALLPGALDYTLLNSGVGDGRKKIVQISYRKCAPWQQVATLLKAFKEQQEKQFDTILVQGMLGQDTNVYGFTNGQLRFDRNVRLGGQMTDRYQIETGNGYESDSVRIVLTE